MLADREEVDFKDYVSLFLAFIQTIFLPLIVLMIVIIVIVLLLSFIRPVEKIFLPQECAFSEKMLSTLRL